MPMFARSELFRTPQGLQQPPATTDDSSDRERIAQTPILWAYERGHDQIVALLKYYANKMPDSDVCSEYRWA